MEPSPFEALGFWWKCHLNCPMLFSIPQAFDRGQMSVPSEGFAETTFPYQIALYIDNITI